MRKRIAFVLTTILLFVTLTGCFGKGGEPIQTVYPTYDAIATPATPVQTQITTAEPLFSYTLDYHKTTPIMNELVGEEVMAVVSDIIDAFLAYETSVGVDKAAIESDEAFMEKVRLALYTYCPPFMAYADFDERSAYNSSNGTVEWDMLIKEVELENMLKRFENSVSLYFDRLATGDTDILKALLIYNSFTQRCSYDHNMEDCSSITKEVRLRTSSYTAITKFTGVCYSFAYALAFLYTQAGIDCATVHGNSSLGQHRWALVKLNDKYYYCDPTWDLGGSFRWFGVTSAHRAEYGSYSETQSFLLSDYVTDIYTLDDDKFRVLYFERASETFSTRTMNINRENWTIEFLSEQGNFTLDCG